MIEKQIKKLKYRDENGERYESPTFNIIGKVNELVDYVNKLNYKGKDIKLCPIHDNTHYCKYKIGDGCKCKCTCTKEEKPAGSLDEMAGYGPLSTYKARLKDKIYKLPFLMGEELVTVLDIIDEN